MSDLFGGETIPVPNSPESGHEESTAVETEDQAETVEEVESTETEETEETTEQTEDTDQTETEDPDEGNSEELLAGKYKTPEDLAKAYRNAQKKISQQSEELRQYKQQPETQNQQQMPDNYNDIIHEEFQRNPAGTINYLVEQQMKQQMEQHVQPLQQQIQDEQLGKSMDPISKQYTQARSEEGMVELFSKVGEIAQELGNPKLAQNPSQRVLKMAAQELWGESTAQVYQKAKSQGRQEAQSTRQQKQGLDVKTSKKPQTQQLTPEQEIRQGILNAGSGSGLFG